MRGPAPWRRLVHTPSQIQIVKRDRISVRYRRCRIFFLFPAISYYYSFSHFPCGNIPLSLSPSLSLSLFHPFLLPRRDRRAEAADDRSPSHPRFFLPFFAMETAQTFATSKMALFCQTHRIFSKSFYEILMCICGEHATRSFRRWLVLFGILRSSYSTYMKYLDKRLLKIIRIFLCKNYSAIT